ncbi:YicC family protein [Flavobacteriales bacterium]|nr:YicC family protein [Flavobacteriales bacterium]MDG1144908.1 YicC family protein [Flavobacteriales bacterium]MDG1396320.1 YicC family protein [Flavobacteriales bacterium]
MIQSMTGFGRATLVLPKKKITVEAKSLNSKQIDINTRIPSFYKEKELDVRSYLSSTLRRGKIELAIFVENTGADSQHKINQELVTTYMTSLQEVGAGNVQTGELLSMAMRLPDALKVEHQDFDKDEWLAVMNVVKEAVAALVDFRKTEGLSLEKDIKAQIATIERLHNEVPKYEQERINTIKSRISAKLTDVLQSVDFDRDRLEQEMIYFIEKLDVSEEKVRLKNHCSYFIETMNSEESNGKKLGFISQELGREINTMGSKANHTEIQKLVVQMKDALEKIKEQTLNVL